MNRQTQINTLQTTTQWDIIIIGGGASGLGTAVDAASRGYKTVLFEAVDFAKGTSSRSTKLVHGGVRYLVQGELLLVIEALKERGLLLKNAGHLVKNLPFVIPIYRRWKGYYYAIGLTIYDILSGNRSLGKSKLISKQKTLEIFPNIKKENLKNGVIYYDGQFDDSRLAINLAQTAIENNACVLNYFKVNQLIKNSHNKVTGVQVIDQESNEIHTISGKIVINATGIFTNSIMKLNDLVYKKYVVPSQGIHLVFDASFSPKETALMIPKTTDGRVLFIVPWHDKIVIGTTDTLIKSHSVEPIALESEIEFVLNNAQYYLEKKPQRSDILSVFAGLRPLAAPDEKNQNTKEISRSHKILLSDTGLITITGGKWTTYRKIAQDAVDKAISTKLIPKKNCITEYLAIHGNKPTTDIDRKNHLYIYGADIPQIIQLQENESKLKERLHPNYDYTLAEVVWAIRNEMARTIDDILSRRVRLLFIDAQAAIECSEKVSDLLTRELQKDEKWKQNEMNNFKTIAKGYTISKP